MLFQVDDSELAPQHLQAPGKERFLQLKHWRTVASQSRVDLQSELTKGGFSCIPFSTWIFRVCRARRVQLQPTTISLIVATYVNLLPGVLTLFTILSSICKSGTKAISMSPKRLAPNEACDRLLRNGCLTSSLVLQRRPKVLDEYPGLPLSIQLIHKENLRSAHYHLFQRRHVCLISSIGFLGCWTYISAGVYSNVSLLPFQKKLPNAIHNPKSNCIQNKLKRSTKYN